MTIRTEFYVIRLLTCKLLNIDSKFKSDFEQGRSVLKLVKFGFYVLSISGVPEVHLSSLVLRTIVPALSENKQFCFLAKVRRRWCFSICQADLHIRTASALHLVASKVGGGRHIQCAARTTMTYRRFSPGRRLHCLHI